jgi:RNA polymerase-binding transcription factor DksA
MIVNCDKCGEQIPEGRLKALPTTKVCVGCSGVSKKRAITVTRNEGEDIYSEIVTVSQKQYEEHFGRTQQGLPGISEDEA